MMSLSVISRVVAITALSKFTMLSAVKSSGTNDRSADFKSFKFFWKSFNGLSESAWQPVNVRVLSSLHETIDDMTPKFICWRIDAVFGGPRNLEMGACTRRLTIITAIFLSSTQHLWTQSLKIWQIFELFVWHTGRAKVWYF